MTTTFHHVLTLTRTASGTVAAGKFLTPAAAVAGADANVLGVALADAAAGELVAACVLGVAEVVAGGEISAGDTVKSDSQGRAIVWEVSGAKVGIALTGATAAGAPVEVFLIPNAA